jgi:hypothetical protein
MGTARFSDVVKKCGEPESHLILIEPAKDRELQAAIKAKRVMTVFQDTVGSKADRGVIGFEPGPARQFLIFPKPLRGLEGKQIVGMKYELWSTKEPSKAERAAPVKPPKKSKPATPKSPDNVLHLPMMNSRADEAAHAPRTAHDGKKKPRKKRASKAKAALKAKAKSQAKEKAKADADTEVKLAVSGKLDEAAPGITDLKQQVRAAMDALEDGKQITAFNILKRILAG